MKFEGQMKLSTRSTAQVLDSVAMVVSPGRRTDASMNLPPVRFLQKQSNSLYFQLIRQRCVSGRQGTTKKTFPVDNFEGHGVASIDARERGHGVASIVS